MEKQPFPFFRPGKLVTAHLSLWADPHGMLAGACLVGIAAALVVLGAAAAVVVMRRRRATQRAIAIRHCVTGHAIPCCAPAGWPLGALDEPTFNGREQSRIAGADVYVAWQCFEPVVYVLVSCLHSRDWTLTHRCCDRVAAWRPAASSECVLACYN